MPNLSLLREYIIYAFENDSVVEYVLTYPLYTYLIYFMIQVPGFEIHHAINAPSPLSDEQSLGPVKRDKDIGYPTYHVYVEATRRNLTLLDLSLRVQYRRSGLLSYSTSTYMSYD